MANLKRLQVLRSEKSGTISVKRMGITKKRTQATMKAEKRIRKIQKVQ
jgi:hypothetical protein